MSSRKDRYVDTDTFHYYNHNPKNRITGDCTFRAISLATGKPYNECVMEMAELMCKTGYALNDTKGISKYLESLGWRKVKQLKHTDGTKYTGSQFCKFYTGLHLPDDDCLNNPQANVIANIGGHHIVAIVPTKCDSGKIAYKVHDIWDSTSKCIGNYWVLD